MRLTEELAFAEGEDLQVAFLGFGGEEGTFHEAFDLVFGELEAAEFFGDLVVFEADAVTKFHDVGATVVAALLKGGRGVAVLKEGHGKGWLVGVVKRGVHQVIGGREHVEA